MGRTKIDSLEGSFEFTQGEVEEQAAGWDQNKQAFVTAMLAQNPFEIVEPEVDETARLQAREQTVDDVIAFLSPYFPGETITKHNYQTYVDQYVAQTL